MLTFFKKMFGSCGSDDLKTRQQKAHEQDKQVREGLSEKQIDHGLKDTMEASDPVAKY